MISIKIEIKNKKSKTWKRNKVIYIKKNIIKKISIKIR